ncbi:S-adenosyl-L-methionine-dependent methyltransferase [Hesseltinella vesiculosa]|uniref:S-adenosyl-L-methionine-dependent methyltransferase n=1 Tax=Hesseltinella vesiculosa TaxID=101127 RepID=A0A1X2G476_9FUNG|nr:S-adenosyl-L-methionine-dependent methyltransferase [Hesseltinella vesiculosa]
MKLQEVSKHGKLQLRWTLDDLWTVEEPIGSPEIFGYRTKCEFSIGKNLNDEPTVGFLLGMYRDGVTSVIEPGDTIHIPEKAKAIAAIMQAYVRESRYPVYDRKTRKGVWRTIMVKVQNTGDVLLLIQISADDLDSHQLEREKQALINYWSVHGITTMMLQKWNGESHGVNIRGTTEILTGDGYVYEQLLEHQFRISSSAFFQVNTKATELLYAKCAEWCNLRDNGRKTTLLDLCCGCGSIGISIGKAADRVVGIEMNSDAIDDALFNVQLNMVTNAQYFASKVEEKIDIVANEQNEDVIAVLDPPRSGVHSSVIKAVRESSQIQKLIFISCDANQAMQNFVALCRPTSNKFQGIPFKPRRAVIVDLFPHTDHYELMVEFVRVNEQSE